MNKQDYIAKGRAAFAAGETIFSHPVSWQERAYNEGWSLAHDESDAGRQTHKGAAQAVKAFFGGKSRVARDFERRAESTLARFAQKQQRRRCAAATRRISGKSHY